jgi:membrane associated rhomboid family serine protease
MGIHDRDYYRDSGRSMFDSWGRWNATTWFIIINCGVFVAQLLTRDRLGLSIVTQFGIYNFEAVERGEVWRLLTSAFLHATVLHIAFNMLVLYWAGSRLEERFGTTEFVLLYLTAALFDGLFRFILQAASFVPPTDALGASGAISAVLVVYAFLYPHQRVLIWFILPMPVWLLVVIYVALDTLGVIGVGDPGVGHAAHLGGALFGLLYYQLGMHLSSVAPSWPNRSEKRTPSLRIVRPDPEDSDEDRDVVPAGVETPPRAAEASDEPLETRVDRVLEKVSKHGQESLTEDERELLFRASELYKKRRK